MSCPFSLHLSNMIDFQGYKFAMYIILPNKRDGLDELISRIDSSNLHRTQILMDKLEVKVSLPKFKIVNTVKLTEILKAVNYLQYLELWNFSDRTKIIFQSILFVYYSLEFDKYSLYRLHSRNLLADLPFKIAYKYRTYCKRLVLKSTRKEALHTQLLLPVWLISLAEMSNLTLTDHLCF